MKGQLHPWGTKRRGSLGCRCLGHIVKMEPLRRVLGQKPGFGNEPREGVGAERPFFTQAGWAPGPATAMLPAVSGCVWRG